MAIRPQGIAKRRFNFQNAKLFPLPVASGDLKMRFPIGKADGVFLPVFDRQKGGGLPNGVRTKNSLATIKQGGFFMRIAKRRYSAGARSGSEAPKGLFPLCLCFFQSVAPGLTAASQSALPSGRSSSEALPRRFAFWKLKRQLRNPLWEGLVPSPTARFLDGGRFTSI